MSDFSFYLFSLPDATGADQRFFVVKVATADAQGRPREKRSQSEAAATKFTLFVARSLKSTSHGKLVKQVDLDQFLKLESSFLADVDNGEVVYELKEKPITLLD